MLEINKNATRELLYFFPVTEEGYVHWVIMQGKRYSDNDGTIPQHRLEDVAILIDTDFRHWLTYITD